jgi:lysophospholipase L1-like esterase
MLKYLRSKTSTTISLIIVFLFSMTGTVFGKASTPPFSPLYDYVALGDSLASGQTPYGIEKAYGYTDILADKLDSAGVLSSYVDYGVSGKTSAVLKGELSAAYFDHTSPLYISLYNAEFVTLDIGANDFLTLPEVKNFEANPTEQNFYLALAAIQAHAPAVIPNIATIIGTIKAINPAAKIYVMGYYNALGNYLTPEQEIVFLPLLADFNASIQGVVDYYNTTPTYSLTTPVTYVDTMASMDKHLAKYLPGDIHPTVQGYRAIAQDFWTFIQPDFLRGLN